MKTCIKIVLLLLLPAFAFSQQNTPDSLRKALQNATTDSARFNINFQLEDYFRERNRNSALNYIDICLAIAQKNNQRLDEIIATDERGYILMHLGRLAEALQHSCFPHWDTITRSPKTIWGC